jgi:hypothetical protein
LSPRQNEVDRFFTDQSQQKSFQQKSDDDEWDETRRWIDELHQLDSSLIPEQQNRNVGPMGMSRDSLNGTITGINLYQLDDNRHEQPLPTLESISTEQKSSIEQEKPIEDEQKPSIEQQENNNTSRLSSRRPSSAGSTSKYRTTPIPSPRPPSSNIDEVK